MSGRRAIGRSGAMRLLFALLLGAGACATGHGEAATGTVEIWLVPEGPGEGPFHIEEARLAVAAVALVGEAEEPANDDHVHTHAHLREGPADETGRRPQSAAIEREIPGGSFDLLGGEQLLGSAELPVGHWELALEPGRIEGDGGGCTLRAAGHVAIAGEEVPLGICLPLTEAIELPLHLDVEHGRRHRIAIGCSLGSLLDGIALDALEREEDGSIAIGPDADESIRSALERNLRAGFEVGHHDPGGRDHEHGEHEGEA